MLAKRRDGPGERKIKKAVEACWLQRLMCRKRRFDGNRHFSWNGMQYRRAPQAQHRAAPKIFFPGEILRYEPKASPALGKASIDGSRASEGYRRINNRAGGRRCGGLSPFPAAKQKARWQPKVTARKGEPSTLFRYEVCSIQSARSVWLPGILVEDHIAWGSPLRMAVSDLAMAYMPSEARGARPHSGQGESTATAERQSRVASR